MLSVISVKGRVAVLPPETRDGNPDVRVNLDFRLTEESPRRYDSLDYLADNHSVVDYGAMLSQQLRRIDGVDSVAMGHYGCLVTVGGIFGRAHLKDEIIATVERTISVRIPWIVGRSGSNWMFRFASPLMTTSGWIDNPDNPSSFDRLTELGRVVCDMLKVARVSKYEVIVASDGPMCDCPIADVVGNREVEFEWI